MSEDRARGLRNARIDAANGETASARHRLKGLLVNQPANLEARSYLAHLYRIDGIADEAGRWGYFDAVTTDVERASYARSCASRRGTRFPKTSTLAGLHWPEEAPAPNAEVAAVLAELRHQAALEADRWRQHVAQMQTRPPGSIWRRVRRYRQRRATRRFMRRIA